MNRIALSALTLFVAGGALFGGWALITGADLGMDANLLDGTPFSSFVIPGYILAFVVGGTNLIAAVLLLMRLPISVPVAMIAGAILTGWIAIQVAMIGYATILQPIFFAVGIIIMTIARRLWLETVNEVVT
jgi:hypothetical protein